ncbi:MAG: hypothetical protein GWP03_01265 [Proteobacteria bacterium]|nr:hypothetical protein [Pseudomonadota bacterium]
MKGVIVLALKEMVKEKFGKDKWESTLKNAGFEEEPMILPISNVDDQTVLKVIDSLCKVVNISITQAGDAFGDYWINVYAQEIYQVYFTGAKTAKDFLLKMDLVHIAMTKRIPDAHPPRFEYDWKDEKTMIMKYKSQRGLIDIMVGLIKGVGKFYKENLKVTKLGDDKVEIVFP